MKIVGRCKKCGSCCTYTNWVQNNRLPALLAFYGAFFGAVDVLIKDDGWTLLRTNYRCKSLSADNRCMVHKQKPSICRGFPKNFSPEMFSKIRPKGCGYSVKE